jgi:hypothetical protein
MYQYGGGGKQDEAMKWYRKAADQGYAEAQEHIGFMYAHGDAVKRDYVEAMKWFRKAADQGDAGAQVEIGVLFEGGKGVKTDNAEAEKWYRKAADQGDMSAQYNLGTLLEYGRPGLKRDGAEAFKWLRKAADQGEPNAQKTLGGLYEHGATDSENGNGSGVKQDYVQAYMWYTLGCSCVKYIGKSPAETLAEKMTPDQIAEAQRLIKEWRKTHS